MRRWADLSLGWLQGSVQFLESMTRRLRQIVNRFLRRPRVNDAPFADINVTHRHEERLREESMALIAADPELARRLQMIEKVMALIFGYTIDHTSRSEDESTMQLLGIRLFNAAASGLKLALSGYYQTAFHQARDIMETGYLLDFFRTSPEQRSVWKASDRKTRRKLFDPVKVRIALDERDGDTSKKREAEYNKLSELASHATFRGFRLTTRGGFGELGPFVEKTNLLAWLEEMVLRLGPSAVMYANQFPEADAQLVNFFQQVGTELVQGYKRPAPEDDGTPPTGSCRPRASNNAFACIATWPQKTCL
jgi:hypothetical protein